MPWNPFGAIIGPLGLIALVYGRKKKDGKAGILLVLLLVGASVGMTLAACGGEQHEPTPTSSLPTPVLAITLGPGTSSYSTPSPSGTPTLPPVVELCPEPEQSPTPMGTSTPPCPVCNSNPNARMFLEAVLKHQNDLRPGFSVALLLAMGAHESGADHNWSNSTVHGGVLQLRRESGNYHHPYPDTPEGYEQNVVDAIATINFFYDGITNGNINTWLFDSTIDEGQDPAIVTAVRSVLYYNGSTDWIHVYRDPETSVNKPYLEKVAQRLSDYVPTNFGYSDDALVVPLQRAQQTVNYCVDTTGCGY